MAAYMLGQRFDEVYRVVEGVVAFVVCRLVTGCLFFDKVTVSG